MKKRSIFVAAAAVIPAIVTLTGCTHVEQEPMPPGVFIQTPAPDTGTTPMPPADKDAFTPAPQDPAVLPPPVAETGKKEVKEPAKKAEAAPAKKAAAKKAPAKKAAAKKAPAKVRENEEKYIVKKGDNLSRIAYRYGISVKTLQEYNKLKTTVIHPKQVLLIPATAKAAPAKAAQKDAKPAAKAQKSKSAKGAKGAKKAIPQDNVHIVRAGEDFTKIARLYKLKVSDIQKANPGVDSRRLRIGQKLKLTAGAKSAAASPAPVKPAADKGTAKAVPAPAPAAAPAQGTAISSDKLFEDVKDPESLPDKSPAAPAAKTPAASQSNDVLGTEINNAAAPLTDEVVTMDGGKQAVTIRTKDTTIDALAKRFNSTPAKIREANGLLPADGTVKVGSRVIIP